jgi:hypothetical protein
LEMIGGEGMIRCFHPQHMDRKNMNKSRILMIDVELFSEIHGMIYMIWLAGSVGTRREGLRSWWNPRSTAHRCPC